MWTPGDVCGVVDWKPYPNATGGWSLTNHGDKRDLFSVSLFGHRGWFPLVGWYPREGWYILGLIRYTHPTERKRVEWSIPSIDWYDLRPQSVAHHSTYLRIYSTAGRPGGLAVTLECCYLNNIAPGVRIPLW